MEVCNKYVTDKFIQKSEIKKGCFPAALFTVLTFELDLG